MNLQQLTDEEFIRYLQRVADDFRRVGMAATADDYEEMIRRLKERNKNESQPA